jgi:hypothetical protein
VVTQAHRDLDAVRALVEPLPELAKASWDWGFGDWESPLGAASHTGHRDIAEYLLSRGARPTVFSSAMLGQLSVVRAFVESGDGIQGIPGPHGIPLLQHARAGGDDAAGVVAYLEDVGGADRRTATVSMSDDERASFAGLFEFGPGADDTLLVEDRSGSLFIQHAGDARRGLTHLGEGRFHPAGAPSVRITVVPGGPLELRYGGAALEARRR